MIEEIKECQDTLKEKSPIKKIQVFIDYVIFNLGTDNPQNFMFRQFPSGNPDTIRLFLLRLQLFVKYEDQVLSLKEEIFEFLKQMMNLYLESLAGRDPMEEDTIKDYGLVISLSSRIFCKPAQELSGKGLDFSLILL